MSSTPEEGEALKDIILIPQIISLDIMQGILGSEVYYSLLLRLHPITEIKKITRIKIGELIANVVVFFYQFFLIFLGFHVLSDISH